MSSMYDYDVVIIGAGSAGLVACKLANGLNKKVALIEKRKIGGDCTWFGCIPSKTLIKSANIAHQMTRLKDFGLAPLGPVQLNAEKVMSHVRAVVEADAAGHPVESYEAEGINVLFGGPRFIDNHRIELDDKTISSQKFIICTGSHPLVPDIEGFDKISYLTNETVFDLKVLPKSMIVLGAGPIGIELSFALNRLGVDVTVLLRSGQILKKEDKELVDRLTEILLSEGVTILPNTQTKRFSQDHNIITVTIEDKEGQREIEAESVLVAVGREPNIGELALEKAGVEYDSKGIKVDKHLRTTAKNIYAAGDVVPPYLFTHMAEYEAVIATTNACLPLPIRKTNYENVLWCTYTDPELARAGLTEEQAREKYGDKVKVYRWEFKDVDRAKTDLAHDGLSKFVCDSKGKLLGIHILGHNAAELMHEAQLAKSMGLSFSKIASVIHAYPSYSDAVRQPAKKCYIDVLQNNFFIKLFKKITPKKN
ncbi:MAG: dihydrolipoyl dehydrogenase family protein [Planctomycetota bacterium]